MRLVEYRGDKPWVMNHGGRTIVFSPRGSPYRLPARRSERPAVQQGVRPRIEDLLVPDEQHPSPDECNVVEVTSAEALFLFSPEGQSAHGGQIVEIKAASSAAVLTLDRLRALTEATRRELEELQNQKVSLQAELGSAARKKA